KIRASGFTIAELDYLLRDHVVPPSGIAPTEESIALVLGEVRSGLQKIATDNLLVEDPTGDVTGKKLATLSDITTDLLRQAMALIDGTSAASAAEQDQFIDAYFAKFLDPADAKAKLVGPSASLTTKEDRFAYVLAGLLPYLSKIANESFIKQQLGNALQLQAAIIHQLLTSFVKSVTDATRPSIQVFLDPAFIANNASQDQFNMFILLQKVAALITSFKITAQELPWIAQNGPALGWLDFNALPLAPTGISPLFTGWERLLDLIRLRNSLPASETSLFDVFALAASPTATQTGVLQKLSDATTWDMDNLQFLIGSQCLGFTFPDAYKDERALERLRACFVMIKRLGVSAAKVLEKNLEWTQPDVTSEVSRRIKQSVKAKYDDDQWLAVAKPLRDILREKQRSSLVSYLVAHPYSSKGQDWRDSNGLYEHFLIDVETDPCMITSRIKQAISSVQLFAQRCLMNLEKEQVVFTPEEAREWKWMKNYRVWEANRKVFLYPENWIEPELRDNKSPFFKDLENELLQNDITKDSVEEVFAHYLEKLDEVARLEICGMYFQFEPYGDDHNLVLHVFGRTPGIPHMYYYRQWVDLAYWTAWEKVDVDIEGDHLIPVVYNRRLRIYWPIFTEKADENQPIPDQNAKPEEKKPIKHWEIKMAWSEYKHNKWSAKKVSLDTLESPREFRYDRNGKRIDDPSAFAAALIIEATTGVPQNLVVRNDTSLFTFKGLTINPGDPDEYLAVRCYAPDIHFFPHAGAGGEELLYSPKSGWWPIGEFRLEGCYDEPLSFPLSGDKPLVSPSRSTIKNMMLVEDQEQEDVEGADDGLYILTDPAKDAGDPILGKTPGIFRLLYPHQIESFISPLFFYQDKAKTFFVIPKVLPLFDQELKPNGGGLSLITTSHFFPHLIFPHLIFEMFYHPFVCEFIKQFNRYGVDGLLDPDPGSSGEESWPPRQLISHMFFNTGDGSYEPDWVQPQAAQLVDQPYPKEEVDFSPDGSYSLYNWELFFHAPLLIADRLSKNQRFEEAQQWFHYIFDPTAHFSRSKPKEYRDKDPSANFWKVQPFFENTDVKKTIEELLKLLDYKGTDPDQVKRREEFEHEVTQWQKYPFNPHLIARNRITAYQKTVVMKYIDNLIAWGDQLFRQDTIEAINEATQIYILAAEILGDRPQDIPPHFTVRAYTYNQLEPELDGFSNKLVQVENLLPPPATGRLLPNPAFGVKPPAFKPSSSFPLPSRKDKGAMNLPPTFYFCISQNDNLLGYWDTVADRLFKIRHCMNIEGVVRELPLFEPPIDPALLVRAVAAGIDIGSALNDLNAALPHYRFGTMLQKAVELCNDLKALGAALLSALEKRDAEALALLRSSNEISLLKAIREIKKKQIDEANDALEALNKAWEIANERYNYYSSREFMNAAEIAITTLTSAALISQTIGIALDAYAGVAHLAPAGTAGAS
ncbi:MAG: neuraminidase-like domain-containing protein, partial [Ktedonobacteraceae bacterium]